MPKYSPTKQYRGGIFDYGFQTTKCTTSNLLLMAASKNCIKFTTHEVRCPALRCKSVTSTFLIVGVHRVRPMEAAPSRLSSTFPWSTLMSEPDVSLQHALPLQSLDRRLQWVQWFQWHQCVQCLLESLVRHLKPQRASMLVVRLLVYKEAKGRLAEGRISSRLLAPVEHSQSRAAAQCAATLLACEAAGSWRDAPEDAGLVRFPDPAFG